MKKKCVCLYSGGLDSRLIIKLMANMGVEVIAFHGVHAFESRELLANMSAKVIQDCRALGASEIIIRDQTQEIMKLVTENKFGLGKNLNPCTDCRINTVRNGFEVMREVGADFICSGEVLGQRPKSQQRHTMNCVVNSMKKYAGEGLLLRPLCAKLLDETIPEKEGWVDREKLYDFSGRSRYNQMALAEELGIKDFPSPAGGCLLTDIGYSARLYDLMKFDSSPSTNEVELLKFGRHYRAKNGAKIISSRNGDEGDILETLAGTGDAFYITDPKPGAFIMVRGEVDDEVKRVAVGLAGYYSKYRETGKAPILKYYGNQNMEDGTHIGEHAIVDPADISELIVDREEYLASRKTRNDYGRK